MAKRKSQSFSYWLHKAIIIIIKISIAEDFVNVRFSLSIAYLAAPPASLVFLLINKCLYV